jgi:AraC family transcriptional regulator of adaptative response/methylated-DNA-[protein]-cysteine methyltransferase
MATLIWNNTSATNFISGDPISTSMAKTSTISTFAGKAWQQVLARDTSADGQFVYAVKSTGVYCRPSCPSRKPERRNVTFFSSNDLAEQAGYRACLRCEPSRIAPKPDPQADAIAKAAKLLSGSEGGHIALEELARASGLGKFALLRGFKRVLGVSPAEYARQQRRERVRTALQSRQKPEQAGAKRGREESVPEERITDAIYSAGFGSSSRLYENVDATLGMSPTAMKDGGKGEIIRYALADSPLGLILVGTTERGLCAVLFADSGPEAAAELRERFPQAALRRDDEGLGEAVRYVLASLGESPAAAKLPFHVRATAFQQRVWQALMAIPRGETRTYAEIAESIGSPQAVRAVGTACGSNQLALVIPCHRVVGSDGSLTGYRWGKERKRQLLEMERGA